MFGSSLLPFSSVHFGASDEILYTNCFIFTALGFRNGHKLKNWWTETLKDGRYQIRNFVLRPCTVCCIEGKARLLLETLQKRQLEQA